MKKLLSFFILMLLPMVAGAEEPVLIDGIYYNLVSMIKEAEVTKKPSGKYTDNVPPHLSSSLVTMSHSSVKLLMRSLPVI